MQVVYDDACMQGCQALLHRGETPKPPYEIIEDNNGKCPNCSRRLSIEPINFEVKPIEELKPIYVSTS